MRKQIVLWIVAAFAVLSANGVADTVTLKSGEKIEGKITGETATELTIDVRVAAGIMDTRTVPKTDVAKVEKEQPDVIAWQPLKNIKLGPNSLPPASYDQLMGPLRGFITQFPTSPNAADAQKTLAALEQEQKRVSGGEVKLNEKWLSKEEAEKERYQINALLTFNFMRDQSTRNDVIGALNSFDIIEKQYPGARVYPDAVELARRLMQPLKTEVDRRLQLLPTELAERERGIQLASEPQRLELQAVAQREQAAAEARIADAERRGVKWPPLIARSEKSLSVLSSLVASEAQRLNGVAVAPLRQSIQLTEQARASFAKKELDTAEQTIRKATELWNTNEAATRLQAELASARSAAPPPEAPPEPEPVATTEADPDAARLAEEAGALEDEKPTPFLLTPGGIITVLVILALVIGGYTAYRKIAARANETLE